MIGRALGLLAGFASLLVAAPASAGPAMDKAVTATLLNNCLDYDALVPPLGMSCATSIMADYGASLNLWKADAAATYNTGSWWNIIRVMNLPAPFDLTNGGSFGGGGAGGTWSDYCDDFDYRMSIQNTLIVPTVSLSTGANMVLGPHPDPHYRTTFGQSDITHGGSAGYDMASSAHALTLWKIHHRNRKWASDFADGGEKGWQGCYAKTAEGCMASTVPYCDHHGCHWMDEGGINYSAGAGTYTNGFANHTNKSCPEGFSGGGNVHFYLWGAGLINFSECTWYIPNYSLSASGYYYPAETALPASAMNNFPTGLDDALPCGLDPELIKKIAEKIRQRAETNGAEPTQPVTEAKTGGEHPTMDDLKDQPAIDNTGTPTDPAPPPANPGTGGGSGGGTDTCDFGPGGCDNPNTGAPTLEDVPTGIMDPIFDWLPDLPSITFPNIESECPVWNVNLTEFGGSGWQWLMDSHCDIAEQNRAAIGALMLAIWGIAAALVILRA